MPIRLTLLRSCIKERCWIGSLLLPGMDLLSQLFRPFRNQDSRILRRLDLRSNQEGIDIGQKTVDILRAHATGQGERMLTST